MVSRHLWISVLAVAGGLGLWISCSGAGRTSDTLSRDTALEILQQNSAQLLSPDNWFMSNIIFFRESNAPADVNTTHKIEFCDQLVAEGLLKRAPSLDGPLNQIYSAQVPQLLFLHFGIVEQEGVGVRAATQVVLAPTFVIDKVSFTRVAGIQQDGKKAMVDAEITRSPTKVYERLQAALSHTREKLQLPSYSPDVIPLPTPETLSQPIIHRYHFAKYDDGWRLGD